MSQGTPLRITYFGHATLLIEMDGVRLLTDPLLRSHLLHLKRTIPVPDLERFQTIDAILISHLHRDHLDLPSLDKFGKGVRLIVPRGAGEFLRIHGFTNITEFVPGGSLPIKGVRTLATQARHAGSRPLFGPRAECLGFLIQGSETVYFAGDTDLFPEMADLAEQIDAALLPVWGWGPTLGRGHMDPLRAAQSLRLLQPRLAIPIHWGTYYPIGFNLLEPGFLKDPPHAFQRHSARIAPHVRIQIIPPGGSFSLTEE
jgi:L-ascorbate metabolism protein UlaG (beta-lactamase superfamily)